MLRIRSVALATLACVCLVHTASAGIYSAVSSTPSVATIDSTPVYSGPNINFAPLGLYSGAVLNQSLLSGGTTILSFAYEGIDYGVGLRPVMNVTNNTGVVIDSITFAIASAQTSFFGFATTGVTSANASGAVVNMSLSYSALTSPFTVPLNLAPGASIGIYVPTNVGSATGSFALEQTINLSAVPEPATIGSLALGLVAFAAVSARRRGR